MANIVIAGASGGIGRGLTEYFDKADNELRLIYNENKRNIFPPKNATRHDDTRPIDVLINVMGNTENVLVKNMGWLQWETVVYSNLNSVFLSCKETIPHMKPGGHIINISSVLGTTGCVGASNYAAAKGGVEAFTKSLALELIRDNIFVNGIALGYFNVGMGLKLTDMVKEKVLKQIPLGEFGEPEEIHKMVQYIIDSKYLVGQILHLNGGFRV